MFKSNGITYSIRKYRNLEGQFVQIPHGAFILIENSSAFKVYCYLLSRDFNKDYQYVFPSEETIARETKLSKKTVNTSIKYLQELRLIHIEKFKGEYGKYTNNCYFLFIPIIHRDENREKEKFEYEKRMSLLEQQMNEKYEEIESKINSETDKDGEEEE